MKNFHLLPLSALCAAALFLGACTLEKEPEIPSGVNSATNPVFLSAEVTPDTNNNFQAKARLISLGNLNILQHGWVWSEATEPTLQDSKLESGNLTIDSFQTEISGLELGKVYYLRPFVSTGMGTFYGPEQCSFLGVNFSINTDTEIFKGANVQFTNTTPGSFTYLWNFGDGTTSTEASPKHLFDKNTGNFMVRLTANIGDCHASRTVVLKVVDDPFEGYWVHIPGGIFMMGCTPEQVFCDTLDELETPVHEVSLDAFFLGKTEITQRQWFAVLAEYPSFFNQCGLDCPVETVSWYDINDKFLPALDRKTGRAHRLPSEAEWEYAARGGQSFIYAGSDVLSLVGWYADSTTHPVAQKLPNTFGTYDMSGNVWEWVEDDYHADYAGAPSNGSAWIDTPRSDGRMYRGGSWKSAGPEGCRNPNRGGDPTDAKINRLGFRIARSE